MMKHRQYHETEKDLVDNENIPDQVVLERNRYQKKRKKKQSQSFSKWEKPKPNNDSKRKRKKKMITLLHAAMFMNEFASVGK